MSSIRRLQQLAALTTSDLAAEETIQRALPLLLEGLAGAEAALVYGADAGFRCFGSCTNLELSDIALWLVNRDLTSRGEPCVFDLRDGQVVDFRAARARRPCQFVAALIPMPNRAAEMLIVRGPWARGLGVAHLRFLLAALPSVALLLEKRLDSSHAQRQQHQLSALANITGAMSESEDLETVLTSIASTIAVVTGIDYVSIDVTDADGTVTLRALNGSRQDTEQLRERWKRGARKPDPVREAVIRTGRPMLLPDAQNDKRIPAAGRDYFMRTLIRSVATFPLLAKEGVPGVLSIASHQPLDFSSGEVELLEGLAAQVATAITGIQLYQELTASREQLQALNDQLQENVGIEQRLARTDSLTGLPNRRYIEEVIDAEGARAARYGQPLCIAIADLDHLKEVNDTSGHQVGDASLKFVANIARQACRTVDLVGRWGGDEFVFILPSTTLADAKRFVERFRQTLSGTRFAHPQLATPIRITASIGLAQANPDASDDPRLPLERADKALYAAKAAGRNRTKLARSRAA